DYYCVIWHNSAWLF
nr:immunoglobulin light chain junction region [Macaca mulatta]MOX78175.1 immunoglobulin light chain junction region [Macaca mulatta]MOX81069.1 immunoglobulin light chain junction region [Macaca mulatta]MOX82269.1 immunoglobulin light chain junction region [Macaca mulatta]MOX83438.1 immunoglobulin light chain junction region [Macaca mulatta]